MFERYTESARRALFFARYEVSALGAVEIGPEHLLLGLLRDLRGLVGQILAKSNVSYADIRRDVEQVASADFNMPTSTEVPFTPEAQASLQAAAEEADRLGHEYIGTEHLLLGLLRVEHSRAAAILSSHGLHVADVREMLVSLPGEARANAAVQDHALAVYTQLLEAWNRRDAAAFAALFSSSGSAIGFDGSPMNGPGEIESELRAVFSSHQTAAYVAKVRYVRPLGTDAALLRAGAGMVPPWTNELNPAVNAVQSVVFVREAGEIRIALLQNTPAAFHGRPELAQRLTDELSAVVRSGRVVVDGTDTPWP